MNKAFLMVVNSESGIQNGDLTRLGRSGTFDITEEGFG